ncbi:hypothetical protein [Serinicoccus kebangsaanensis]|uniref:hypothetical protein n=1 Tax=Serinicoccus kebangsaanensis TaxID=2602069 RepID=UPI00124E0F65|nr:hypothetical protein [Serinicoccus kebangsaanensis]
MTRSDDPTGQTPRSSTDQQVRDVLGGAFHGEGFDHAALVAGAKGRAGRIRRRRAVTTAVAAAVVVPSLAGAGWILGNRLVGPGAEQVEVAVATRSQETTPPSGPDEVARTTGAPDGEAATRAIEAPPWQPVTPPDPVSVRPDNPDLPNRVQIPDPRPVGVDLLDALGPPQDAAAYPRTVPLSDFMAGGEGAAVEPHSARDWFFYDGTNEIDQDTVQLTVTAWDDSAAALAAIRDGGAGLTSVWVEEDLSGGVPEPLPWPGHDDADHLLVGRETELQSGDVQQVGGALVRQGDYLVGVTVRAAPGDGGPTTLDEAVEAAAEIAQKSAENLAYLGPENPPG